MATKIASLYAEIGADTTKLEDGLKRTQGELKNTGTGMQSTMATVKSLGTAFAGATAFAVGFNAAFNTAMDFGKAGAELEYAQQKFDRLSQSIGTTSDVLESRLRSATKGLVSDSQLVASAGDFMALGLANTADEVVRLTKVAGGLGMDMNQLVLTLTNQTTMRFDQLGVRVDGFDAKVAKLKATGMDANAAFKEAFLQQAEEQLAKVGERADSATAAFDRLTASQKNSANALKQQLAGPLGWVAGALADVNDQANKTNTTWMNFIPGLNTAHGVWMGIRAVIGGANDDLGKNEDALKSNAQATETYNTALQTTSEYSGNAETRALALMDAIGAVGEVTSPTAMKMQEYLNSLDDATVASDKLSVSMSKFTKELLFQQAAAGLSSEAALNLAKSLGLVDEKSAYASEKIAEFKQMLADGVITLQEYNSLVYNLGMGLGALESKHITITLDYIENRRTDRRVGGDVSDIGMANGGSFVIPPGYPNDSYYLGGGHYAQSGETVTVTPAGHKANSGQSNITYNIFTKDNPGTIKNALTLSRLMGGAA